MLQLRSEASLRSSHGTWQKLGVVFPFLKYGYAKRFVQHSSLAKRAFDDVEESPSDDLTQA